MDRAALMQFLADHHWVASSEQLRTIVGMTKSELQYARRTGLLVTPARGVVALAAVEPPFEGRALMAQLAAGQEAFVSGPSAGVLHGLRSMPRGFVEITVREARRLVPPPWCRVVRTSWIDEQRDVIVRDDGIRLASPLRMLFGLAAQFNQHRFERAAEDVWHRKLASPDDAADYLAAIRRSGRSGVTRFETWLDRTSLRERPSHTKLELDFVDMIAKVGLPSPQRQHPLWLATGELIHLDLAWPDARLAIEPGHSWWHGGDLRQRLDQARDRACNVVGWQIERYDESAQADPWATAQELLAIYRRRVADLRDSPESGEH